LRWSSPTRLPGEGLAPEDDLTGLLVSTQLIAPGPNDVVLDQRRPLVEDDLRDRSLMCTMSAITVIASTGTTNVTVD